MGPIFIFEWHHYYIIKIFIQLITAYYQHNTQLFIIRNSDSGGKKQNKKTHIILFRVFNFFYNPEEKVIKEPILVGTPSYNISAALRSEILS